MYFCCPRLAVGEKKAEGVEGGGGVGSRRGGRMMGGRGAVEVGGGRDGAPPPVPLGKGTCGWGGKGEEDWGARGGVVGGVTSSEVLCSEGEDDITMASSAAPREEVGCGRLIPRGWRGSAANNWEVDGSSSVGTASSSSSLVSWSEEGSSSISSFRRAAGRRVSGDVCWGLDCVRRPSFALGRGVEKLNLGVGANCCCEGEGWVEEKRRDEEGAFWEGRDLGGAKRWGDGVWDSC